MLKAARRADDVLSARLAALLGRILEGSRMTTGGWVALVIFGLMCLGPLRRLFFRNWRFTLPASFAGWGTFYVACSVRSAGEPCWIAQGLALVVGLGAGAAVKAWLDETLDRGRPG
jgi:hypothetical protein